MNLLFEETSNITVGTILSIILLSLVGLYCLFFIYVFSMLCYARYRLKVKTDSLNISFAEERRILIEETTYIKESGKTLDKIASDAYETVIKISISKININSIYKTVSELSSYRNKLNHFINDIEFEQNEGILKYREFLDDIDKEKRRQITLINSDIDAFNYWRKIILFKWFFDLIGIKEKSRLN